MNNTNDKNLRNRKKRLNVPCVRLIFQEAKCQDTKEPNDIKTISTNLTQNQIEQQKKTDEELKRMKQQETIDYLNATFPSYPDV